MTDDHDATIDPADLIGVLTESAEELRTLVVSVLTEMLGEAPDEDEDGDYPIGLGDALMFVRVPDDQPIVEIYCPVLDEVHTNAEALESLNADVDLIDFRVIEGTLLARAQLLAVPFVRLQLIGIIEHMASAVSQLIEQLQEEFGGVPVDFEAE